MDGFSVVGNIVVVVVWRASVELLCGLVVLRDFVAIVVAVVAVLVLGSVIVAVLVSGVVVVAVLVLGGVVVAAVLVLGAVVALVVVVVVL